MAEEKKEPKVELPLAESRGAILSGKDDTTYDVVDCPEWGCRVRVQSLKATQVSDYEAALWRADKDGKPVKYKEAVRLGRGKLMAWGIVDADGKRLFADDDARDLSERNAAAVTRVVTRIAEMSGMSGTAVEEEEKN